MSTNKQSESYFEPRGGPCLGCTGLEGRYGPYIPDERLIDAANVALTLQLPLLLTGEPGCGKTEFAYVAAHALCKGEDREPLECQIRSDTRARDLLYHYDAIRRFADGQHSDQEGKQRALDARRYVELRPLGIALMSNVMRVVLIDEIDKAQRDLPNDLLRELDRKRSEFEITEITDADARYPWPPEQRPVLARRMTRPPGQRMPFVVITSNVERQLPDAFLRRCVFFHIEFPNDEQLKDILVAHVRAANDARRRAANGEAIENEPRLHLSQTVDPDDPGDRAYIRQLVDIFVRAREIPNLVKKPSTAEWLDWVGALDCCNRERTRARIARFWEALPKKPDDPAAPEASASNPAEPREPKPDEPEQNWSQLPMISCLLKLEEDLTRARRAVLA